MQKEFYQKVCEEVFSDHKSMMLTLIENGENCGAKAIYRDGQLLAFTPSETKDYWRDLVLPRITNYSLTVLDEADNRKIFAEPLLAPPQLVICGGGHISLYLAEIAHIIGFEVVVIDDRFEFANSNRFSDGESYL